MPYYRFSRGDPSVRVNMDSSIANDPRFRLVARSLGVKFTEVIGSCFLVWLACYERRSERLRKVEADVAAGLEGFADALISEDLADEIDGEFIMIHGVKERIEFLSRQAERGAKGGRSKKNQSSNKQTLKQTEASAKQSPSECKANTLTLTLDHNNSVVAQPAVERPPAKIKKSIPPEATGLARSLATLIAARLPNSKPARQPAKCVEAWAPDIEKIHRIDKRGWQEIEAVLAWSQDDEFWQANILSGKKLREKFDTLEAQMRKSSASRKPQPPPLERL